MNEETASEAGSVIEKDQDTVGDSTRLGPYYCCLCLLERPKVEAALIPVTTPSQSLRAA